MDEGPQRERNGGLMTERGGLHRALGLSRVYRAFQGLVSRPDAAYRMRNELYPELGARQLRVLDIGCGPAAFYARYRDVAGLEYVGIESNEAKKAPIDPAIVSNSSHSPACTPRFRR